MSQDFNEVEADEIEDIVSIDVSSGEVLEAVSEFRDGDRTKAYMVLVGSAPRVMAMPISEYEVSDEQSKFLIRPDGFVDAESGLKDSIERTFPRGDETLTLSAEVQWV